jgi:hypothetical protein
VVDVTVADAAATAPLQPATIVTSDAGDFTRLAGHVRRGGGDRRHRTGVGR